MTPIFTLAVLACSVASDPLKAMKPTYTQTDYDYKDYLEQAYSDLDYIGREGDDMLKRVQTELSDIECFWQLLTAESLGANCVKFITSYGSKQSVAKKQDFGFF
jgi:hypothetical protein